PRARTGRLPSRRASRVARPKETARPAARPMGRSLASPTVYLDTSCCSARRRTEGSFAPLPRARLSMRARRASMTSPTRETGAAGAELVESEFIVSWAKLFDIRTNTVCQTIRKLSLPQSASEPHHFGEEALMTALGSAFSRLWRLVSWPARVAEARREFVLLAKLDDRGLADIGLTRQDLRDATAFALSKPPSAHLMERAREREALARAKRRPRPAVRSIAAE